MFMSGLPKLRIAALMSFSVIAEKCALKFFHRKIKDGNFSRPSETLTGGDRPDLEILPDVKKLNKSIG